MDDDGEKEKCKYIDKTTLLDKLAAVNSEFAKQRAEADQILSSPVFAYDEANYHHHEKDD